MTGAELALLLSAAALGGLVRGFTGGAGANIVLAPSLSLVLGARQAVPLVLLLGVVTSVQLLPDAVKRAHWPEVLPVGIAAWAGIPLGILALTAIDQEFMQRGMAVMALLFTALQFGVWRISG